MKDDSQANMGTSDAVLQELGWRNTPKINFAPERRIFPFSPVIALLVAVLIIEVLVALTFFGRLQDARADALSANDTLESMQRAVRQERAATEDVTDRVEDISEEIARIEQQSAGAFEIYNRLTQRRPEWAAALQALLRANSPDFRIFSLAASPPAKVGSPAQINLTATASGAHTVSIFLDYMDELQDFLELASWNTSQTSDNRTLLEAVVNLK
ncbi:MAG: hypothetical protein OXK79_08680 [Chloroflexota bacterium]|nr:hypothetical protein [Chloroflexota bacterium]